MSYKQLRFAGIKICYFMCFGPFLKIKMFLVTSDFEHNYFKKWCYASCVECKSCEIMYILEKKIN